MEIRSPALHSALGREFLCLSPPPSPQLLFSTPSLQSGVSSWLCPPHFRLPIPVLDNHVLFAHRNISHLTLPALLTPHHPSSHSYPFTHPSPASPWYHLIPATPNFHSHCLRSISSPTSDSFPITIPLPLLPSIPGLLLQIHSPLPSLSMGSHCTEAAGCKVSVLHPFPTRELLT